MAEDGFISAMWRSLVATPEYTDGVGDVESPAVDHQNPHEAVGVCTYYAEAESSLPFHVQVHQDHQYDEPIYCRDVQEIPQYYPEAGEIVPVAEQVEITVRRGDAPSPLFNSVSHCPGIIIYKVPEPMRKAHAPSYTPIFMSIGPYHFKSQSAKAAEKYKDDFVRKFQLENITKEFKRNFLQKYTMEEFYEEGNKKDFKEWFKDPKWMMRDACFLLVCFDKDIQIKRGERGPASYSYPIFIPELNLPFPRSVPNSYFTHDICLLENQIPLVVIEEANRLSRLASGNAAEQLPPFRLKIAKFIHKMLSLYSTAIILLDDTEPSFPFVHILDYYHIYFKPSALQPENQEYYKQLRKEFLIAKEQVEDGNLSQLRYRATDLKQSGVIFKKRKFKKGRSLLDIKFPRSKLKIPILVVDGQTRTIFRNIIAYEQKLDPNSTGGWHENYFTAYVKFMANLVASTDDVKLLTKEKIIVNHLGKDEKILDIFGELMQGVHFKFEEDNYLMPTYLELHQHYKHRINWYVQDVRSEILKSPRTILGALFAALTTFITIIVAYFTLRSHLKSNN